jgi:hypothetical protein
MIGDSAVNLDITDDCDLVGLQLKPASHAAIILAAYQAMELHPNGRRPRRKLGGRGSQVIFFVQVRGVTSFLANSKYQEQSNIRQSGAVGKERGPCSVLSS